MTENTTTTTVETTETKRGRKPGQTFTDEQILAGYSRGYEINEAYSAYVIDRFGELTPAMHAWLVRNTTVWNGFRETPEYSDACKACESRRQAERELEEANKGTVGRKLKVAESDEDKAKARAEAIRGMRKLGMTDEQIAAVFPTAS